MRQDVIEGKVSLKMAEEEYGVVINPETFEIDFKGTRKLREKVERQ